MFEKVDGTSAIQGGDGQGHAVFSMGQNLVAFCGWRRCAQRLRLPILLESVAVRPEGKGKGERGKRRNIKESVIFVSTVLY